ncbi:amidohydrolase family protein [Halobium palmae]|uniref:Amidohydrolase family protein n=1 Tax=Halobium palmae TaxID=1776492 RepID=A0ABD5RUI8_9EURY
MSEFLIRNATKLSGQTVDIEIYEGIIQQIKPAGELENTAEDETKVFDAEGRLATASLAEPHIHLDYALTAGDPRWNSVGTLSEGIDIWEEYKSDISKSDVKSRARRTAEWLVSHGVTYVRTHADTTEKSLSTVEGLLELKEELADFIDIEVVAFPQNGIFASEDNEDALREAVEMGADAVGGIPHAEPTREAGEQSVKIAVELAQKYDRKIDLHIDETDDPGSRFTEVLAHEANKHDVGNRTTASHTTALHSYPNSYASKVISLLSDSGVSVITNPPDNSVLQGRHDDYPRRRGHTRIDELHNAGVTVGLGHDSVMDPWYHYGKADPLDAAYILIHYAHMNGYEDVDTIWKMLTQANAEIFGLSQYGIVEGNEGSLVVYDSYNKFDTLRTRPSRCLVLKEGVPVARTEPATTTVFRNSMESQVNFQTEK